jgi:hypothetical protein
MRMSMKRFARLGNRFSNKAENHAHSVAIHFMQSYVFTRACASTPVMVAGRHETLWSIADMVSVNRKMGGIAPSNQDQR